MHIPLAMAILIVECSHYLSSCTRSFALVLDIRARGILHKNVYLMQQVSHYIKVTQVHKWR